ncbi:hypothetical protein EVAR_41383_1 [Eumeta japonica]|uniref:Uncharacterized protein n=1 Tax=Eumeta variegata TaxID=151549 RepID=A0A4C1X1K4_EUMVA|nr:hypothetical protein EVAR_41383_1 [Eumeta japonica]
MRVTRKEVVNTAHRHWQPQRSHRYVAGLLGRNYIFEEAERGCLKESGDGGIQVEKEEEGYIAFSYSLCFQPDKLISESPENNVIIAAHKCSKPLVSHRCIAGLLRRNRISEGEGSEPIDGGVGHRNSLTLYETK